MFSLLDPLAQGFRTSRLPRPVLVGLAGWVGVVIARHYVLHAPWVVGGSLAAATAAVALRERGAALAAIGVATAAAFTTTAGLGPLLVVTGVVLASAPAAADRRLIAWSDAVDGLIALPALAGLATAVAAAPSQRATVVGAATAVAVAASRFRPARVPPHPATASVLGLVLGVSLAAAAPWWTRLGELPGSTRPTGTGVSAAFAVFAVVAVAQHLPRKGALAPPRGQHAVSRPRHRTAR